MTIGVDEVGRGAWAGPMLVCAVKLTQTINGLTDSKKLSKASRQQLASQIIACSPVGYGWVSAAEIDDYGLSVALKLAAAKALNELDITDTKIVVDGNIQFYDLLNNSATMIKADLKQPSVSAASIVAKVTRDTRMAEYSKIYPQYGFDQHVGYGTLMHRQAIASQGLSPIHRQSFKIV